MDPPAPSSRFSSACTSSFSPSARSSAKWSKISVFVSLPTIAALGGALSLACAVLADAGVVVWLGPDGGSSDAVASASSSVAVIIPAASRPWVENACLLVEERPVIGVGGWLVRSWPVANRARESCEGLSRRAQAPGAACGKAACRRSHHAVTKAIAQAQTAST